MSADGAPRDAPARIADLAVVGDGRSMALIARHGDVVWLCWPRVDSDAVFAALLDEHLGGRWSLAPRGMRPVARGYRVDSAVLETRWAGPAGEVLVVDFMPALDDADLPAIGRPPEHALARVVTCVRGAARIASVLAPRPRFGAAAAPWVAEGTRGARADLGRAALRVRADAPLHVDEGRVAATFTLRAGERCGFALAWSEEAPALIPLAGAALDAARAATERWWRSWVASGAVDDVARDKRERAALVRSAITLKLLQYAPSGAIVAAATTSLPERAGGSLNWDYRYCWLRDASMTARALFGLGHEDEARAFVSWLLHATRTTQPALLPFYDVFGRRAPAERELPLAGHLGSRPVRAGNAARQQLQLDVVDDVVRAAAELAEHDGALDRETQRLLASLGDWLCAHGRDPDHGIWEPREAPRHHTHSRGAVLGALRVLLRLARRGLLRTRPTQRDRWRVWARVLDAELATRGWSRSLRSFTATLDAARAPRVDAALLQLALREAVAAGDARVLATWLRVRARLAAPRGLLFRTEESAATEGAFLACTFWEAELLARAGRTARARASLRAGLACATDVGLLAEEVDPDTGAPLGNVPQGFSHVGHINAVLALLRAEDGR